MPNALTPKHIFKIKKVRREASKTLRSFVKKTKAKKKKKPSLFPRLEPNKRKWRLVFSDHSVTGSISRSSRSELPEHLGSAKTVPKTLLFTAAFLWILKK